MQKGEAVIASPFAHSNLELKLPSPNRTAKIDLRRRRRHADDGAGRRTNYYARRPADDPDAGSDSRTR